MLEREVWNLDAVAGVLDGDRAEPTVAVEVEGRVLVEVSSLSNVRRAEFDVEDVGILEIANFLL